MISQFIFLANGLWFAAAFLQFSLAQDNTVKILVPRGSRGDPLVRTLKASVSFLGGMNLALAIFALYLATGPEVFARREAQSALLVLLAAVNFSQFACNLPVLLCGRRKGDPVWPVLKGPMAVIFTIDGILTVVDAVAAAAVSG